MGPIPFIMKCGTPLKGGDEAEEIQEMLKEVFGDRILDLKVEFDGGVVTLGGNCDSQATREEEAHASSEKALELNPSISAARLSKTLRIVDSIKDKLSLGYQKLVRPSILLKADCLSAAAVTGV
jgi:hypothetical protein